MGILSKVLPSTSTLRENLSEEHHSALSTHAFTRENDLERGMHGEHQQCASSICCNRAAPIVQNVGSVSCGTLMLCALLSPIIQLLGLQLRPL